uniref:glucuronosyltransferase n=1 Tax=Meloidogyne enterolobii TaxID=390850 RepID=A0A6V7UE84_MELEN|nr:unnamed protein product [Meloidogyne enterolobii]
MLAKALSEYYIVVDIIVYSKEDGIPVKLNPMPNDLQIIEMNIDRQHLDQEIIARKGLLYAYLELKRSQEYVAGIFDDLMQNPQVKIGEEYIGILHWILQRNHQQKYSFGIADFTEMAGSFAVFEYLEIEKTFNVFPFIILPNFFQFFGIDLLEQINEDFVIPAINIPRPGDWIFTQEGVCHFKPERFWENLEEQEYQITLYRHFYDYALIGSALLFYLQQRGMLNKKEYFSDLFSKISYHFVNQHLYANFKDFPEHPKIVYIGGIHVEENEEKLDWTTNKHNPSNVLISFGTFNESGGMTEDDVEFMIDLFGQYAGHHFQLKIPKKIVPLNVKIPPNVDITHDLVQQKQILFDPNTKLFISHCGQNSLTEAIYAGVPLICIPNSTDQFLNSSIVEQLGIGIYVSLIWRDNNGEHRNPNFKVEFENAVYEMSIDGNKYHQAISKLRAKILDDYKKGVRAKNIFLQKIEQVIGV